jgi:4'-phosphopantetheinyl transferase
VTKLSKINSNEIHVWQASLANDSNLADFEALLSEDELIRADRFYFKKDRNRYVFARGILRRLLAKYLAIEPETIVFEYGPQGKPSILPEQNFLNLQFNLSHSHNIACYGITIDSPLGIDVEYHKPDLAFMDIAKRFFSIAEIEQLKQNPSESQQQIFYTLWTCKEAFIKALGQGLFLALDKFTVDLTTMCIIPAEENRELTGWKVRTLELQSGYSAAIALREPLRQIYYYTFSE